MAQPEEMRQSNNVSQINLWAGLVSKICRNSDSQTLSRARGRGWEGKTTQAQLTYKKNYWTRAVMTLYEVSVFCGCFVLSQCTCPVYFVYYSSEDLQAQSIGCSLSFLSSKYPAQ